MTGRRVSRQPYKARRDRKEVLIAVGVALAIVVATVIGVWILAPDDESPPTFDTPTITSGPSAPSSATTTTPPTTDPAPDPSSTTVPSSGG